MGNDNNDDDGDVRACFFLGGDEGNDAVASPHCCFMNGFAFLYLPSWLPAVKAQVLALRCGKIGPIYSNCMV